MQIQEVMERLMFHEGLSLMPYKCPAGYLSIGVGRNLVTNPLTEEEKAAVGDWSSGITKNAALYLLKNDVMRTIKLCRQHIPFWSVLDSERRYVLLDMCFNMGINKLLSFKKMLACMEIGDYQGAAKECLNSKYGRMLRKRAARLAKTIETGVFEYA